MTKAEYIALLETATEKAINDRWLPRTTDIYEEVPSCSYCGLAVLLKGDVQARRPDLPVVLLCSYCPLWDGPGNFCCKEFNSYHEAVLAGRERTAKGHARRMVERLRKIDAKAWADSLNCFDSED